MLKQNLQNKYLKWLLAFLRPAIFLLFFIVGIYAVQSFTEPASGPSITEPTNVASSSDIYVNLGVTSSVTADTVTIFNFFRQVYTNIGGTPSSATGYTLDSGKISDLIGTTTPDAANGKTAFNYLKLINDTLDFPELSSVLSSDTVKNSSGSISNCTGGDASCYADGGKWYSVECADSTTSTKTNCYVDDTVKYINDGICSSNSTSGFCYINTATFSAMDADLTAAKIANGVTIFGVAGSHRITGFGTSQSDAGDSCSQIKTDFPDSFDGDYWIDTTGGDTSDAFEVYCEMTKQGGGWTLAGVVSASDASNWMTYTNWTDTGTIGSSNASSTTADMKNKAWSGLAVTQIYFETSAGASKVTGTISYTSLTDLYDSTSLVTLSGTESGWTYTGTNDANYFMKVQNPPATTNVTSADRNKCIMATGWDDYGGDDHLQGYGCTGGSCSSSACADVSRDSAIKIYIK